MKLNELWFLEGHIDFELQKYRLLAYLQEVNKYFNENKLYPQLSDVIFHFNNLVAFRENKKLLQHQFPRKIDHLNIEKLEVMYQQILDDDEVMQELESIAHFATEKFKGTIDSGAEIYELIEKQTRLEPVGIQPVYKDEGYMLLRYGTHSEIKAYAYNISLFEHKDAQYKGIRVSYINSWHKSFSRPYESIKKEIFKTLSSLSTPAFFSIETDLTVPLDETFLPIAKRMLVRHLTEAA